MDSHLNTHPENIVDGRKVTPTGDDPKTIEEVVDGRRVVVVRRRLRPEAVLQPDVIPQPLHRPEQLRRDVGRLLAGGERVRTECQVKVGQVQLPVFSTRYLTLSMDHPTTRSAGSEP